MALIISFFYFILLTPVHGMPTFMQRNETSFPPLGSNHSLKALPSLLGKSQTQDMDHPLHVMQMYQNLLSGNFKDLSIKDYPVLQESDSVLSLIMKDCTQIDNRWALSFDMSSFSISNELRLAELRIHMSIFEKLLNVTLDIYHCKGDVEFFLGSVTTEFPITPGSTWKVFNLTNMLQFYFFQREILTNGNTEATSHTVLQDSCKDVLAERVMLLVFSKDKPSAKHIHYSSLLATVKSSKYIMAEAITRTTSMRRHRRHGSTHHSIIRNNIQSTPMGDVKPMCRRVDIIVDFAKTEWGSQIIYPKKFNAYRCEGSCPIPLNETFDPTNHAYIKSLIKFFNPERTEFPSCAPVRMSPLSMLLIVDNEIDLKHHEDMIVDDCGCH